MEQNLNEYMLGCDPNEPNIFAMNTKPNDPPYTVKERIEFGITSLYVDGPNGFIYTTGAAVPAGLRPAIIHDMCRQLNAAHAAGFLSGSAHQGGQPSSGGSGDYTVPLSAATPQPSASGVYASIGNPTLTAPDTIRISGMRHPIGDPKQDNYEITTKMRGHAERCMKYVAENYLPRWIPCSERYPKPKSAFYRNEPVLCVIWGREHHWPEDRPDSAAMFVAVWEEPWADADGEQRPGRWAWEAESDGDPYYEGAPPQGATHWMPLPAAPPTNSPTPTTKT